MNTSNINTCKFMNNCENSIIKFNTVNMIDYTVFTLFIILFNNQINSFIDIIFWIISWMIKFCLKLFIIFITFYQFVFWYQISLVYVKKFIDNNSK